LDVLRDAEDQDRLETILDKRGEVFPNGGKTESGDSWEAGDGGNGVRGVGDEQGEHQG